VFYSLYAPRLLRKSAVCCRRVNSATLWHYPTFLTVGVTP